MDEILTQIGHKISAEHGLTMAASGMSVVFAGVTGLFARRKKENKNKGVDSGTLEPVNGESNMDEVAASIGLALHCYLNSQKRREIAIVRQTRSPWKESHRARNMERL